MNISKILKMFGVILLSKIMQRLIQDSFALCQNRFMFVNLFSIEKYQNYLSYLRKLENYSWSIC